MFKRIFFSFALACSLPASAFAATVANFDTTIGITLQVSPAEELLQGGGFLPGSSNIVTSGDFLLLTGDDGGGDACCSGGFVTDTAPNYLGEAAFSATGGVNSIGSVFAAGERRAALYFGNVGAATETITLGFDIQMMIMQSIDPLIGGAAASGTEVTIQHDGVTIFNESLASLTDNLPLGASFSELFTYSFDLAAQDETSSQFQISITGGVHASSDASDVSLDFLAPVPLPAGGLLLLAGLGALGLSRRLRG